MSTNVDRDNDHSKPIPITIPRGRAHSVSESSSSDDSGSPSSPISPLQSPLTSTQPRVAPISPGSTPILNYFLSQSPKTQGVGTFPFRRGFAPAVFEEDSEPDLIAPTKHARRASTAAWPGADRFNPQPQPQAPPVQTDRAAGLLRRLSLGGAALRAPQTKTMSPTERASGIRTPPNSPVVERIQAMTPRKTRRATLAPGTARPKRAPSPMGERILTGHFDGFN
ncbi:hypothetical protein EW026_g3495 [Hermanssonia centrifuga]|uniref:Uncharacterized protein n=1 Tax=Hermanssonia centrifuga TaxID=98765 RepID=A0A4S4KJX9_9APHY|nr:hypothetical protein EW026_g3495 [Hermanssonia centrifuga]